LYAERMAKFKKKQKQKLHKHFWIKYSSTCQVD